MKHERPGGRALVLEGHPLGQHPLVVSEFGGIAVIADRERSWAYSNCATVEEFASRFHELLQVVRSLELFAGFCYTQFADTYQEANGLLAADRTPKIPLEGIAMAVLGVRSAPDFAPEAKSHPFLDRKVPAPIDPDATIILLPKR